MSCLLLHGMFSFNIECDLEGLGLSMKTAVQKLHNHDKLNYRTLRVLSVEGGEVADHLGLCLTGNGTIDGDAGRNLGCSFLRLLWRLQP